VKEQTEDASLHYDVRSSVLKFVLSH